MKEKNSKVVSAFTDDLIGDMDATALRTAIKNREITTVEVVKTAIERVKKVNPIINAVSSNCYANAIDYAKNVQGDLAGIPIFIKDQADVKGLPTLHGTRAVSDQPKKKNDPTVKQILSTGAVILGKSTSSELGVLPCGETLYGGNTLNPRNTDYSTGGSSAGSAALVTSGAVPISHAMDGGGSIRIPAACCGLVGLKPSVGRHKYSPGSFFPIDFVEQGIVSRSVRDTANYFAAIERHYQNPKLPAIGKVEHPGKKRLKIGMFTKTLSGIQCDIDLVKATRDSAKFCEDLGHEVLVIDNPFDAQFKVDFTTFYTYVSFLAKNMGAFSFGLGYKPDLLEPFTKYFAGLFPFLIAANPLAFKRLKSFNDRYEKLFDQYDVLLCPTISCPVPKIGYWDPNEDKMAIADRLSSYVNSTIVQNICGAPAISLPMGECHHDMPIGIQFAAKRGEERKLLELAFEIEAANGFKPFLNEVTAEAKA